MTSTWPSHPGPAPMPIVGIFIESVISSASVLGPFADRDPRARTPSPGLNTAAPPFVSPGEGNRAAGPFLERGADVHGGDLGLARFSLANRVGARLSQQQRLLAGDVLEAGQIRAQLRLVVQVHVEGVEIEEREIEELGRRKVDVREEGVGRRRLRVLVQAAEKTLDAHPPVPAHDARRDFVAERDDADGRMCADLTDARDRLAPDLLL